MSEEREIDAEIRGRRAGVLSDFFILIFVPGNEVVFNFVPGKDVFSSFVPGTRYI